MAKKKYYVVWSGRAVGIFESWPETEASIKGFPGAQYKSFSSRAEAEAALSSEYQNYVGQNTTKPELTEAEKAKYGKPILDSIAVDAACSGNPGTMEYQGVDTNTGAQIFHGGPYENATNNIGEFIAIVHALEIMRQAQDNRPIYSDSKIAISWVRQGECKTQLPENADSRLTFQLIRHAEKWLANHEINNELLKWETKAWGEIPADFGRK